MRLCNNRNEIAHNFYTTLALGDENHVLMRLYDAFQESPLHDQFLLLIKAAIIVYVSWEEPYI